MGTASYVRSTTLRSQIQASATSSLEDWTLSTAQLGTTWKPVCSSLLCQSASSCSLPQKQPLLFCASTIRSRSTQKLHVLDQKLLRAQISEEDKLKPLHERITRLQEELAAERLSREVMDERKSKEIKAVENTC